MAPPNIPSRANFPSTVPDSRQLPRILCLHGGGVNAAIFEAQSRSLIRHLQYSFRLVWADGPFLCDPHPDVVHVYGSYSPFRRWLRWLPEHPEIDDESCIDEIGYALRSAMADDDRAGGSGEWVGLLGFSQGAKLSHTLMLEQQCREEKAAREGKTLLDNGPIGLKGLNWRLGLLLAGRAPPSNLNPEVQTSKALVAAGALSEEFEFCEVDEEAILRKPTIHVHGMNDHGLHLHRRLLHDYCTKDSTTLIEWDGAHRVPIKSQDVEPIVEAVYDVAEKVGVEVTRTVSRNTA